MQNKLWMWVWFFGGKNFSNQIPIHRFAWFAGWRTPDLMRTQEKVEHVATSRLPGRWGSLDSSSAYPSASAPLLLAFFRQLVVTMDINIVPDLAASASSSDEIHGPGDYISSCLARTRPNTLASTAQAVDTCGSEPYLELHVTLGTYGPEHTPERRPE